MYFLSACHSLLRLIAKELANETNQDFGTSNKFLKQIQWMIEQNIVGMQSDLKYTGKRLECAKGLRKLASQIVFHDMFNNEAFLSKLIEDAAQVSVRRFVISAPRDNFTEPFRFSSRHSEFVRLRAKALLAWTKSQAEEDDEFKKYKVVI